MGVLAVTQRHSPRRTDIEHWRQALRCSALRRSAYLRQPSRDGAVIVGGRLEGLPREAPLRIPRQLSGRAQFIEKGRVVRGRGDDGYVLPVFRGGADHGGSTDVDVFDQLFERCVGARGDFFELIQVDDNHVDGFDAVLPQRGCVLRVFANREDRAGDLRMHRFHSPIEHLGKAGDIAHVAHRNVRFAQKPGRAAGGNQVGAELYKGAGEFGHTCLVGNADEDSHVDFYSTANTVAERQRD